jgi:CRISPR-associated protein Cmr4
MPGKTKEYKTLVFRIQALTNLHPGGGDSFYGAVDKTVQYDPATGLPAIYSSSLKGALREYFEEVKGEPENSDFIRFVFGSPVKGTPSDMAAQGSYHFFGGDLLSIPVPERDYTKTDAFHRAASDTVLERFRWKTQQLGYKWDNLDSFKIALSKGLNIALQTSGNFPSRFAETALELPVIARNQLNNGKSENLWYEELLPQESLFGFIVQADLEEPDYLTKFKDNLDGKVIQIGANATVGYGYCLFTLINA